MRIGGWVARVALVALMLLGSLRAARAEPRTEALTPERLLEVVIDAQSEVDMIAMHERDYYDPPKGTCHGKPIASIIPKSDVLHWLTPVLAGEALGCYLETFIGCSQGDWFVAWEGAELLSAPEPFTRSKVTIIEQSADRVVADITEAVYPQCSSCKTFCSCAGVRVPGSKEVRPFTDAEVAAVKTFSRYTVSRGADGIWRVTDRKPSFEWTCPAPPPKNPPARGKGARRQPPDGASAPKGPRVGGAADPSVRR